MDSMGYPMDSAGTKQYFSKVTDGHTSLSGIVANGFDVATTAAAAGFNSLPVELNFVDVHPDNE